MTTQDLATLSAADLRVRLHASRERGAAAETYAILKELAVRRDAPPPVRPVRARPVKTRGHQPIEPRALVWPDADDDAPSSAPVLPPMAVSPPTRKAQGRMPGAGFAIGAMVGVASGWWGASIALEPAPPRAPPAPVQRMAEAPISSVPLASAPQVGADLKPPPAAAPEALPAPDPAPVPEPAPVVETAKVEAAQVMSVAQADCGAEPTPADRAICEDQRLQELQVELRRAYAEALAAHEDRAVLRQRQLAWREARSGVTDPDRLAGLYGARIRRLEAATAQARALR